MFTSSIRIGTIVEVVLYIELRHEKDTRRWSIDGDNKKFIAI
jgi:hypothetical protein